jgi:hypothetical protein
MEDQTQREKYHAYLQTPEWAEKRQAALEDAGQRCQLCNSPSALNVHHRTYERVGRERLGDLTVLCRRCHEKFHGVDGSKPRRVKGSRKPPSPTTLASRQRAVEVLREVLPGLDPARLYGSRDFALLAGLPVGLTGRVLWRLVREGALVQHSKKKYRIAVP